MSSRRLLALPAALTLLLLAGCTGQNAQPNGAETPDPVDDEAILVSLEAVSPGLGDEGSIEIADQICTDIDNGEDSEAIDEHAFELFSEQTSSDFSIDQARQAVQIILTDYCV